MAAIKLPRSNPSWRKQPQLMERYWDVAMRSIEKTLNAILDIPAIEEALADVTAATEAANDAAAAANAATAEATAEASLVNSYISNFTAPLITADSSGNVTIAAHDRVYGDSTLNPTVSVSGATIATGAASAAIVRVYYVDASRAGGGVTYLYTVDPAAPPVQTGNTHSVGAITIPASGTANGNYIRPPGYIEP